jgi:hypothetical protein
MGSMPAKPLPNAGSLVAILTLLMATWLMAHRIAHPIDAEYEVAVGLVAYADYGASLPMARLLRRLGEYNRQSEASRVTSHGPWGRQFLAWSGVSGNLPAFEPLR